MVNEYLSICSFFPPESQKHLTDQENYTLSCILGCTLGQDAILACKPLFALFFFFYNNGLYEQSILSLSPGSATK